MHCGKPVVFLSTFIFAVFCILGFWYQVYEICDIYFAYEVTSELTLTVPDALHMSDLSLCFKYIEIFDLERYNRIHGPTDGQPLFRKTDNLTNVQYLQTLFTVRQLFEFTPSEENVLSECIVRNPGYYSYRRLFESNCSNMFEVSKFFIQEFICYRFKLIINDGQHQFRNPAYALTYPNSLFILTLNTTNFMESDSIKAIVHASESYPTRSVAFSPVIFREYNRTTKQADFNYFDLTYMYIVHDRLPYPYTTDCRDYSSDKLDNRLACVNNCLRDACIAAFNKIPFTVITSTPDDIKPISPLDIANETFSVQLRAIEKECIGKCSKMDCNERYAVTKVTSQPDNGEIQFVVNVPREPSYRVSYRAIMKMVEFLTYVFSCVGTWFGLSVISLSPPHLITQLKRRQRRNAMKKRIREHGGHGGLRHFIGRPVEQRPPQGDYGDRMPEGIYWQAISSKPNHDYSLTELSTELQMIRNEIKSIVPSGRTSYDVNLLQYCFDTRRKLTSLQETVRSMNTV